MLLPAETPSSVVPIATVTVDANDKLREAVSSAAARITADGSVGHGGLRKTLTSKLIKEYSSRLAVGDPTSQSDTERRRLAVFKTGQSQDCRGLELIEPLRSDPSKVVRQAVATAVGELGDPCGVRLAVEMLCDKEEDVIHEAIRSLKKLADARSIRPLMLLGLKERLLHSEVMGAVVSFGSSGIPELLEIINEPDLSMKGASVAVLGRIGDKQAVPSLLMALNHADAGLRLKILEALGLLGDRSALRAIIDQLSDTDEKVQLAAVRAVQRIPDLRAVKPIIQILHRTQHAELRLQSVIALATSGSQKSVAILSALLPGADVVLQKVIAEALCQIDSPEASQTLARLLDADDLTVVTKALVGLRRNPLPSTVPTLIQLSAHPNTNVRRHALEALVETGDDGAVSILEERLKADSSAEVRTASARGLGRAGDRRAVRSLEESLKDESAVRCAAVVSLAGLGDESVIPALLASLKDPAPEVRYHAVSGLGKLKAETAVRAIRAMLEDEDDMVRVGAKQSLQNLGYQKVAVPLARRIMNRATSLMPSQLAGAIPVRHTLVGVSVLVSVVLLGWSFASNLTAGTENATALAKANAVIQARWIPETSDVILLRTAGPADIWDATTGTFKEKIDAPALETLPSHSNLLSRRKQSLIPWTPEGPKPRNGTIKLPPAADRFELSGDAAIAVYVTDENRIATWDTVEGEPLNSLVLATKPMPVVNFDGSVVAGADEQGNIVVLDRLSGNLIGKAGDAGSVSSKDDGTFLRMLFSSKDNTLAVIRHDRVVVCNVTEGALAVSSVTERINAGHARFPNPSAIYSTAGTFLTRLDLTTGDVTKWPITNRQVTLNSWSLSADESLAVASADGKKYGWVLNLKDGSSQELSPTAWPAE